MKALVLYDSFYGNTQKVAESVAESLKEKYEVTIENIKSANPEVISDASLIVIGSPTRAFRPVKSVTDFIKKIPSGSLSGVKTAAFDTRISVEDTNSRLLNFLVGIFGYAAEPIQKMLVKKGGSGSIQAEGFYVKDSEGPLKEGEIERARNWSASF